MSPLAKYSKSLGNKQAPTRTWILEILTRATNITAQTSQLKHQDILIQCSKQYPKMSIAVSVYDGCLCIWKCVNAPKQERNPCTIQLPLTFVARPNNAVIDWAIADQQRILNHDQPCIAESNEHPWALKIFTNPVIRQCNSILKTPYLSFCSLMQTKNGRGKAKSRQSSCAISLYVPGLWHYAARVQYCNALKRRQCKSA